MAYTINLTDGTVFAVVADGTINTSSSMTLVGKNYAGYGEFLDENFIHLLENSSNSSAPPAPLTGQLWFDNSNLLLKMYNGSVWKTISAAAASSTQPTSNTTGDLWFDTGNQQLKIWNGSAFLVVGPAYSSGQGVSGAVPLYINDISSTQHIVTGIYAANSLVSIANPGSDFIPAAPYSTNFPKIFKGTTVWNTGVQSGNVSTVGNFVVNAGGNATLTVTSTGANLAGYVSAAGNVTGSYFYGNGSQLTGIQVTGSGVISTTGNITGNNITATANVTAGTNVNTGNVYASGFVSAAGNVTGAYLIGNGSQITGLPTGYSNASVALYLASGTNSSNIVTTASVVGNVLVTTTGIVSTQSAVGNIGSSAYPFNTVFAKATSAQYADLAERFEADAEYNAGTVVELGGEKEITRVQDDLSENVFGVISTQAAYLMNGIAGTDRTHPPIAMTGRVPVQVVGQVKKGQRLVSAGNGMARAARAGEATAFNVIGRALRSKTTDGVGTVEAIVAIKV